MAVPDLIATPGAPDANSYVTRAEAIDYASATAGPRARDWLDRSPEEQAQSLISAARRLDEESYVGRKTYRDQALKWPRTGARDEEGNLYDPDTIPAAIKAAQVEIAMGLGDSDPDSGDLDAIHSITIGALSVTMKDQAESDGLPDIVRRRIRHVLASSAIVFRLVRG